MTEFQKLFAALILISIGLGTMVYLAVAPSDPDPNRAAYQKIETINPDIPEEILILGDEPDSFIPDPSWQPPKSQPAQDGFSDPAPVIEKPKSKPHVYEEITLPVPESKIVEDQAEKAPPIVISGPKPKVILVIDDLGLNTHYTKQIIDMPVPMTLAFLPYADHLKRQTKDAVAHGHDLLIHMPMQPTSETIDPGPRYLRTDMDANDIIDTLNWATESFDGYIGLNNHMGSKFTSDGPRMKVVTDYLAGRGLVYLDSLTINTTQGYKAAVKSGLPLLKRDIFLDHVDEIEAIKKQLRYLERTARSNGYAIAIGHPKPNTIAALNDWIPEATANGVEFVRIGDIIKCHSRTCSENPGK